MILFVLDYVEEALPESRPASLRAGDAGARAPRGPTSAQCRYNDGALDLLPAAKERITPVNDRALELKLQARSARIAVVGLGYAGLPMAVEFARAGFQRGRVSTSMRPRSTPSRVAAAPSQTWHDADIAALRAGDRLTASTDPGRSGHRRRGDHLRANAADGRRRARPALRRIGRHHASPSTCTPACWWSCRAPAARAPRPTRCSPLLERISGLRAGEDFYLVFAPERIDPGNTRFTVKNTPKLVGGATPEATRLGCVLYQACIDEVIPVSSPEIAELAKLVENTFRFINISFINEMALLCDRLGVNVWEVIEAAKIKPFAFMAHYPSPGVGGHCIPGRAAVFAGRGARARAFERADPGGQPHQRSDAQAGRRQARASAAGARASRSLGASVLVVGVTYKPDIADIRESAALRVLEEALARGARVAYHDPLMPSVDRRRSRRSTRSSSTAAGPRGARRGRAAHAAHEHRLRRASSARRGWSSTRTRACSRARPPTSSTSGCQPQKSQPRSCHSLRILASVAALTIGG